MISARTRAKMRRARRDRLFEDLHRRAFWQHLPSLIVLILVAFALWSGIVMLVVWLIRVAKHFCG